MVLVNVVLTGMLTATTGKELPYPFLTVTYVTALPDVMP